MLMDREIEILHIIHKHGPLSTRQLMDIALKDKSTLLCDKISIVSPLIHYMKKDGYIVSEDMPNSKSNEKIHSITKNGVKEIMTEDNMLDRDEDGIQRLGFKAELTYENPYHALLIELIKLERKQITNKENKIDTLEKLSALMSDDIAKLLHEIIEDLS